jgi:hypothetical protein
MYPYLLKEPLYRRDPELSLYLNTAQHVAIRKTCADHVGRQLCQWPYLNILEKLILKLYSMSML